MGIFQSIYNIGPQGARYRKAKFKLERAQANKALRDIESQQAFRLTEDPRELVHQKQGMWARGLGKSSINDQNRERLETIQRMRREQLDRAHHVAVRYKQYIKKRQRYERKSVYSQMLDSLLSLVPFIGGAGQGDSTPEAQPSYDYGGNQGTSSSDYFSGFG